MIKSGFITLTDDAESSPRLITGQRRCGTITMIENPAIRVSIAVFAKTHSGERHANGQLKSKRIRKSP
jgi:hypothetical protein